LSTLDSEVPLYEVSYYITNETEVFILIEILYQMCQVLFSVHPNSVF